MPAPIIFFYTENQSEKKESKTERNVQNKRDLNEHFLVGINIVPVGMQAAGDKKTTPGF